MLSISLQIKELLLISSVGRTVYFFFVQKMSVISCIKAALRAIWMLPQECCSTQILNLPI